MNSCPGSNEEVKSFIERKYKVEFPIFSLVEVNGENPHELFKYLRYYSKLNKGTKDGVREIPWNFTKFLINKQGEICGFGNGMVFPLEMENQIKEVLEIEE